MSGRQLPYLFIIAILSFACSQVKAQNGLFIYDAETLDPLPYATISIEEINTGQRRTATTNELGSFEIPFENDVMVSVNYLGYQDISKRVTPGQTRGLYLFPYEQEIDEVVVTGATSEIAENESMVAITVIDEEEIKSRGAINLRDALMNEVNIQLAQDGVLGTTITMQGMSGVNVKVMIDGVPIVGRQNGNIDLSQINMNNIERIEIVEGPLSVVYGTNAIAGVINLITKKNQSDKIEGYVNGFYESTGIYNVDASIGFKKNQHFVQLNGGRYFFDGWNSTKEIRDVEWNPKEQYFTDFTYVYRSNSDWFHRFKASYYQDRILNRFDPFVMNPIPKAFDDWYYTKRMDGAYMLSGRVNEKLLFNSTNSYNYYKRIKNTYLKDLHSLESNITTNEEGTPIDQDTTVNYQILSRSFLTIDNPNKKYDVQLGYDVTYESGKGERFSGEDGGNASILDAALFTSFNFQPNEKLSLQPSVRYGYNSRYVTIPTPSFAVKYDISKKWQFKSSYGMGFRAPALKELYLVFFDSNHKIFGNEDLIPEKSHNVQASVKYNTSKNLHHTSQKLGGFFNYKYDAIVLTAASADTFTYVNISDFSTLGLTYDASYDYKGFGINAGFGYTGISNEENNKDIGRYTFSPQVQLNFSYFIAKWNTRFSWYNKYNGSRYDYVLRTVNNVDEIEQIKIEDYFMSDFNLQTGFKNEKVVLQLGVRNLFDVSNINGTFSDGAHSNGNSTQIGTGRSYFVGLKIGTGR